jgi:predicted amidohydrolase YtcJ
LLFATVVARGQIEPRLAVVNARIITLNEKIPQAEAMVVENERIVYVGANDQAQKICGANCWILNLNGLVVVPGFNDNHVHTTEGGMLYLQPNLAGKSCEEIVKIVAAEVRKTAPGEYVLGHSWDYGTCPNPSRWALDKVSPKNPVLLSQYSGHGVWVNSVLLGQLEIDKETRDPPGGKIEHDDKGEPTGILKDTAAEPATSKGLMSISSEQRLKATSKALELYRRAGITSVQDNTWDPRNIWALNDLRKQGKLTCRFSCWSIQERWYGNAVIRAATYTPDWVVAGPLKMFVDGAFSTKTGWMTKPYADDPNNYGSPRHTQQELDRAILYSARNNHQMAIHALGDRAVQSALDAIEKAEILVPDAKALRFRLEHVQMVRPEDIPRFSKLGVLAAVQPFAVCDPEKDIRILGKDRAREAYPYRSLMKAGAPISFGSDFPAEMDYQPLLGIYYAVTRKNKAGTMGPLNPDQAFTVKEALQAYTMGSAYAEFAEKDKGTLQVGKLADFVVLSKSPFEVKPEKIKDIEVRYTFVGGKQVYPETK